MSYFDPSGADADRYEASGDYVAGTVRGIRLHKQCWGGSWSSSMKLVVVDEQGTECCVYDSSDAAEQRFEMLAVGDTVEVSGRAQSWPRLSIGGSAVPDSGFDSSRVLVADEIELSVMPAEAVQQRALERAKASAVAAGRAADAMREALEEFCGAGGSPTEAEEAVAGMLASGAGIDDWLAGEAETIAQNYLNDAAIEI